ncbi:hypothetical protein DB30_05295 [Enhygromyxa salina]|uniref:Uncharacterized protein n=1 Tax=Enhygromyxa salina TaxID=215803 RepID=A0A0C2D1Q9_9BACT|nr:hypothetical protein [Enhygromyxa salina]KIG15725.1 hypothetical protein DB30_05295 [Enhygromyxa salina]
MFVITWLWLWLRPASPLQEDTSRDLAFARELVDGTQLHLHGAWASFAALHQGTTWIDFLALCQLTGLGISGIETVLTTLLAGTVAVAYLGFGHLLPRREEISPPNAALVGDLAPLIAAVVVLAALPMTCEMPLLWQPILLPVPIVLAHLCLWRLLRDGELIDALALAVLCAFALDVHVVSLAMVMLAVVAVPLASKRPWLATPAALALGLGTLALCSPAALSGNFGILREHGWLVPIGVTLGAAVLAGVLARRRFAALSWETKLRVALGGELSAMAIVIAASLHPSTPALTGRYLLPFVPAVGLALGFTASRASSRGSLLTSTALSLGLLLASWSWLRPDSARMLPIYPAWRVDEFEPVAKLLRERGLTWTELAGRLQGPSHAMVLSHLSSLVDPGSPEPAHAQTGLLLVALDADQAQQVLAELPEGSQADPQRVTMLELGQLRALLLETSARADRLGVELCRDGQDCTAVRVATDSRIHQAHPNTWVGRAPAQQWLTADGREPSEQLLWRFPIQPGPRAMLLLSSTLAQPCAWMFVATEGFEPSASLPSASLELDEDASGFVLVSRRLAADQMACGEHGLFPPSIIETAPEWVRLRELLTPAWAADGTVGP